MSEGKVLSIEDYTLDFDKAADIMFFHRTGEQRLDSRLSPRRSAIDGFFKVVAKKKRERIKRKQINDKVFKALGITPGKANQTIRSRPSSQSGDFND